MRYADHKAVFASSQEGLQELVNRLGTVTKECGTKVNVKRTKVISKR